MVFYIILLYIGVPTYRILVLVVCVCTVFTIQESTHIYYIRRPNIRHARDSYLFIIQDDSPSTLDMIIPILYFFNYNNMSINSHPDS